jgi:hypothetical protein
MTTTQELTAASHIGIGGVHGQKKKKKVIGKPVDSFSNNVGVDRGSKRLVQ